MTTDEIICPECGGNLTYWREYLITKTQYISKNGNLRSLKTSPVEPMSDMEGFRCVKCHWIFNTVNDVEKCEKYEHLTKWIDTHKNELKV